MSKTKQETILTLQKALTEFNHAKRHLLTAWEESIGQLDNGNLGAKDYPFEVSFCELEIAQWVDTFQEELLNLYKEQIIMEDMQVAQIEYSAEFQASEASGDNQSDWFLAQKFATFSHKDSCEFLFYVGDGCGFILDTLKEYGFSETFLILCRGARDKGYKYICFYA